MSEETLADLGKTLADTFCDGLDRKAILEAIRSKTAQPNARDTMVAVWGIEDEAVLAKLIELGVTTETVAAISLTPLVHVAWADGNVDKKERSAVLEAAGRYGLNRGDVSFLLLEGRLGEQPDPALFVTWKSYIRLLGKALDAHTMAILRGEVLAGARKVAEASGGILGLGSKVSKSELAVLDEMEQVFPR